MHGEGGGAGGCCDSGSSPYLELGPQLLPLHPAISLLHVASAHPPTPLPSPLSSLHASSICGHFSLGHWVQPQPGPPAAAHSLHSCCTSWAGAMLHAQHLQLEWEWSLPVWSRGWGAQGGAEVVGGQAQAGGKLLDLPTPPASHCLPLEVRGMNWRWPSNN